jgi:hypothetical protein
LHRDLGSRAIDLAEVSGRQFDVNRRRTGLPPDEREGGSAADFVSGGVIHLSDEPVNPTVSIKLSGVETESIIEAARVIEFNDRAAGSSTSARQPPPSSLSVRYGLPKRPSRSAARVSHAT